MKHFYLLFISLFILLSCTSETEPIAGDPDPDGGNPDKELKACFSLSSETVFVGETLEIDNCSEGALTYFYDFGNGSESSNQSPSVVYEEGGEYTITLTVANAKEESDTKTLSVLVGSAESFYIYPEIPAGYSYLPMEAGIHPQNGKIYTLELREDGAGPGGSKFYYRELDENFESVSHYIADKPFNSNSAFMNVLSNGNQNFHFSRTLGALFGSQELTYDSGWSFLNNINPANKHSFGYLPDGANFLYFGTSDDSGIYKAAIEHRNTAGDTFQIDLHALGENSSMIADMVVLDGGFVAFGGVFTRNDLAPQIAGYKPVFAFFDASLNLVSEMIIEDSELSGHILSADNLNGAYHLVALSNGNLVAYGNGELLVANSNGNLIKRLYFEETSSLQALVSLGDYFVISTGGYLRKFDADGQQQAQLKYEGDYLPEFVQKDGKLYFVAGQDTEDGIKMFYGAVDTNLKLVAIGA